MGDRERAWRDIRRFTLVEVVLSRHEWVTHAKVCVVVRV